MAQGAYVGVSGKARKITGGYIGVGGKARRISKAYIGVGGKARPCWDSGARIAYYGGASDLTVSSRGLAGAAVGGYGIFSGHSNAFKGFTNAYSTNLVRSTPSVPDGLGTVSTIYKTDNFGVSLDNYAVFIATYADNSLVYAYNASLTLSTKDALTTHRRNAGVINMGNNILIGGGTQDTAPNDDSVIALDSVEVYTSNLSKGTPLTLSGTRMSMGTAKNNNYGLFAGGLSPTETTVNAVDIVDAFNINLVRSTPTALSVAAQYFEGSTAGEYALLIHGTQKKQDAYNASLVKTSLSNEHFGFHCAKTTLNDYAIFAGGYDNRAHVTNSYVNTVHTYDSNLVHSTARPLDKATQKNAAVSIGNYALIAGGDTEDSVLSTVVAYTFLS